jgi:paraquat-inducible protein B
MDELISGVSDGLKKFNALDLDGVMKDLRELLESTKEQVNGLDMKEINANIVTITKDVKNLTGDEKLKSAISHLDEALLSINNVSAKLDKDMGPLMADARRTMENAANSLKKIEETSAGLSNVTNPHGPVLMRFQNVLEETERAARAVKELANDLKRNPNALLTGKEAAKP